MEKEEVIEPPAASSPYGSFEHRHNFAVWAAARATQRGYTSVGVLRNAVAATDIKEFVRDATSLDTSESVFEGHHRRWCTTIVRILANDKATYGRAAKLVAVYLKSMFVLGPAGSSALASIAHPPIDRFLLQNLAASEAIRSPHKAKWRATNWTALDEQCYYNLIAQLKDVLKENEPFWALEQYWTITNNARPSSKSKCVPFLRYIPPMANSSHGCRDRNDRL